MKILATKLELNAKTLVLGIGAILVLGILFGYIPNPLPQTPLSTVPTIEDETLGEDSAKWTFFVDDILGGSTAVTGSIQLFSPSDPGNSLETVTVTAGVSAATTNDYPEGKQFFVLYYHSSSTWLRYGEVLTMPEIPTYDSIQTKSGGMIEVYKAADLDADADMQGLKDGDKVWDESTAALTSFEVDGDKSDTDPPQIAVRINNEDDNTAYVDPRGFYDYSVGAATADLYAQKSAAMIITFQRTNNTFDMDDYIKFESLGGAELKEESSTFFYLVIPITSQTDAGVRHIENDFTLLSGQLVTVWNGVFDWPASISDVALDDIYTDDVDIEVCFVSAYALGAFDSKIEQDDMEILGELGASGVAWTNDWSIGGQ